MVKKVSLSLCMIVKDEEKTLERCLNSVKSFVDEIILVDTGSTDLTKDIAKKFNAKVYDFEWINDFSAARNFAFSKATSDYIMWLDGDDYIKNDSVKKIEKLLESFDKNYDYISAEYILGRTTGGEVSYSLRRNRIVKRKLNFKWIGSVHEYLDVFGNGMVGEFAIEHGKIKEYTDRNLKIFLHMEKNNKSFTPRDILYYANELRDNLHYDEAISKYNEFLATKQGWIEDIKTAYAKIIECLKATGRDDDVPGVAFDSFKYDTPRADICCNLAEYYLGKNNFKQATFWYRTALDCYPEKESVAIQSSEYYTWIPSLQLCVCYFNVGNLDASYFFNELAAVFFPMSDKVDYNRQYFSEEYNRRGVNPPKIKFPIRISDYKLYI